MYNQAFAILILCVIYIVSPFVVMPQIKKADTLSIAMINNPCKGCPVAFDRAYYQAKGRHTIKTWVGEYKAFNKYLTLNTSNSVNIKGYFENSESIKISKID